MSQPPATKIVLKREKDAEYSETAKHFDEQAKYVHLDLFNVLDYSGSFEMHIEK